MRLKKASVENKKYKTLLVIDTKVGNKNKIGYR